MDVSALLRYLAPHPVSALRPPSGGQADAAPLGIEDLKSALVGLVPAVPRPVSGPFLFAVDHCFPIKGQGTVLTGTVLQVGREAAREAKRGVGDRRNRRGRRCAGQGCGFRRTGRRGTWIGGAGPGGCASYAVWCLNT